jgi:hypothetical protein
MTQAILAFTLALREYRMIMESPSRQPSSSSPSPSPTSS